MLKEEHIFLCFTCSFPGLQPGFSCTKAPCAIDHQFIEFKSEQPHRLWTMRAIPVALILGLRGLRMTTHMSSIALELVITSTLSRGGLIMKLMKLHFHSLSLHQPLPSPMREALGLCSQGYRFWNSHFLEMRKKYSAKSFLNQRWSSLLRAAAAAAKSLQSCPTLCDPIDSSSPGSPIPGILQARTLEWVAISFSNAWKWEVKVKSLSRVPLLATPWTAAYQGPPSMGFSRQEYWSGVPLLYPNLWLM